MILMFFVGKTPIGILEHVCGADLPGGPIDLKMQLTHRAMTAEKIGEESGPTFIVGIFRIIANF